MSSGLWYEDGISSNSEEDGNVVGEEAGDRGDMRVESTGMSVRKDVWGTRAPAGGKRRKGGTNMIEVVGAHKEHHVVSGIVGVVVEEVCVCVFGVEISQEEKGEVVSAGDG